MDGCYLYASPGEKNSLMLKEEIPVGTILETKHDYKYFTYTNYNGVDGWIIDIHCFSEDVAKVASECDIDIITILDTKLYKFPSEESEILTEIPKHTEIKADYDFNYSYDGWNAGFVQVSYNNTLGWVNYEHCAVCDYKQPRSIEISKMTLKAKKDIVLEGEVIINSGDIFDVKLKYWRTYLGYYIPYGEHGLLWDKIENDVEILENNFDNEMEDIEVSKNDNEILIKDNKIQEEEVEKEKINTSMLFGGVFIIGFIILIIKIVIKHIK